MKERVGRLGGVVHGALALIAILLMVGCGPSSSLECGNGGIECDDGCVETSTDPLNCGGCGITCNTALGETCVNGGCDNGVAPCTPGTTEACYNGPSGTANVGPCQGGTRTCRDDGMGFGPCLGEVTPVGEDCTNGVDDDCNGTADDAVDADGDGWTTCEGDCCDSAGDGCASPELVNPAAFEAPGNTLDDDCDGAVDNAVAADCDSGLPSNSADGMQYAMAMDLCQTTTEAGTAWGVISASFSLASGSGTPNAGQRSIRPGFGTGVSPQLGSSLAVLSTGRAADSNDSNPSFAAFQGGQNLASTSQVPMDWLAANGNNFPNAPGCPDPAGGTVANDPIMLELRIRVPSNARSFNLASNFYSSEYPEWVCSAYNDFFLVLLDSAFTGTPPNPPDKNLAIYTAPTMSRYPVGVNLAFGNTGLFNQCLNGPTGCGTDAVAGSTSVCQATTMLAGTGFDIANPPSQFDGDPGWCGSSNLAGGATGWLVTSGNVVGGEIITLRLVVWDTGDPWYDSVVLLDNFQWSVDASEPGTVID